ncbi:MAG: tyrosine-type recombinase/integrase [Actinomycetota bacterium]|nr:tyrosine-type recombinase/integrase [Actinomycetota bacterium]
MSVPGRAGIDRVEPVAAVIAGLLRPEFNVMVVFPDPDDPVLAGKPCAVKGCDRPGRCRGLCAGHHKRWSSQGETDLARFIGSAAPMRPGPPRADEIFDLSSLSDTCRVEIAFVLQCRHDERARAIRPAAVRPVIDTLARVGAASVMERSMSEWSDLLPSAGRTTTASALGFLRYAWRQLEVAASGGDVEAEYQRDVWDAHRLGVPVNVGHYRVSFERIPQPWLRQAVKTWARARLVGGMSFGAIRRDVTALSWFASWLARARPHAPGPSLITRAAIEEYLAHLATHGPTPNTRLGYLTSLRGFIEMARRRRWLSLPADAAIYRDDLPHRPAGLPRWIPEEVMAQLESEAALARLPDATTRHLVIVIMETGLRAGDACRLSVDCLMADSVGWPCLRFMNTKLAAEQLIPLTPQAAQAITAQQAEITARFPHSPYLFPATNSNPDGARPFTYNALRQRLRRWQADIDLRDAAGRPVRVTAHQFRHTLGTRLINRGVPQHFVQRLLGHTSPQMTATYARLHDTTIREAFEAYCATRVDIEGRHLPYQPDAPTNDAEWIKHHLSRIAASLPNGLCGRPPQQDCPHPNACLTCPDFQTTVEFLPTHRRQKEQTQALIDAAEADRRHRLADNHRVVAGHLQQIIDSLEHLERSDGHHS